MNRIGVIATFALALMGCPSKDNQSSGGAATPTSGATANAVPATGPLANLEAATPVSESWTPQDGGAPMPILFYSQQNVRISASCKQANGQLACAAIQQLRSGKPVDVPKSSLSGGMSAGTHVCMQLKNTLVTGRNAAGSEDGFCKFPDGSLVSTGALEQYALNVTK